MTNHRFSLPAVAFLVLLAACMPESTARNDSGHETFRSLISTSESIKARFGILDLSCYVWTDRMPGSPTSKSNGSPVYMALRLNLDPARAKGDSLLLSAVSLWYPTGDSLFATLNLTTLDGRPAWLGIDSGQSLEFTNDRSIQVFMRPGHLDSLAPHLLIIRPNKNEVIRLPSLVIESVH